MGINALGRWVLLLLVMTSPMTKFLGDLCWVNFVFCPRGVVLVFVFSKHMSWRFSFAVLLLFLAVLGLSAKLNYQ